MTVTAEFLESSEAMNGKPTEQWEVNGAKDYAEALSAIPGDFKVYGAVCFDGSWVFEIVRTF